ncbi:MAG: ABC transporter substrate-binding protein, partial [Desulfohalobiaceae bacterium]|nr:ABC transporter substrate-binding protein [Desulfohalobiaceae bacterium]
MLKSVLTACVCLAALAASPILLQAAEGQLLEASFESIEKKARGSEVRWYMFGGWAHVNAWVDGYVADTMKQRYDTDLTRVPMDAGIF